MDAAVAFVDGTCGNGGVQNEASCLGDNLDRFGDEHARGGFKSLTFRFKEEKDTGHLYQNRFKAFPIQEDEHFYAVMRYVERNAFRANLSARPEEWRWSSQWRRTCGDSAAKGLLADWPLPIPRDWRKIVGQPQTESELEAIRHAVRRGCPFGSESWQKNTVVRLGLESTPRPRGRPRKQ